MVYKLAKKYQDEGKKAYLCKKIGRPEQVVSQSFTEKIKTLRLETDYGSDKLHYLTKNEGCGVSQRQIQKILDRNQLTDPCEKRRGQRKYVRYCWPISNYMWHCDWSEINSKNVCSYIDDCSRKIMSVGEFDNVTTKNSLLVLRYGILKNEVCPVIVLSDKGSVFYANTPYKTGELGTSEFEIELNELGIELWTSRRNHPQTNGKMERWFGTMKTRRKKHPEEKLQTFVKWYNEKRIHHGLGYKTPDEVYYERL
ncbi:MAG: integrase core domain-containing protein [archaeon]